VNRYSPFRIWRVFTLLLTLYLLIKKREKFLFFRPLSPKKLIFVINYLGASFVKLAQVLATRSDFFTPEYLEALKTLHDELESMSQDEMQIVFNRAFKEDPFFKFSPKPIASASIGQVHTAWLDKDTKVAVKLRRLGIGDRVRADIKIINFFNALFRPLFSHYTKNSIEAVVGEFSKMILQEVSLTHELSNLVKFSSIYKDSGIRFPLPYHKLCSDDALVMSFEEGFRFDDKKNILKHNIDFRSIIAKLVDFYTTQMLINGYFHADPHPGNLLVNKKGELILLDFGMVKSVPNYSRVAIIELIKAANEQDYERYISASKKLGTVAYEAPISELAEFTRKMFEIFSNENLNSESMQQLAFEVLESTRDLPFKLPSDAIYILRVSAIIEGLGTTYIENFNGIKDILPILQKNIPKALGAKDSIIETVIEEIKAIPFIAKDLKSTLKKIGNDELKVEILNDQVEWIKRDLKGYANSLGVTFAFMLGGIFTLLYDKELKEAALILFTIGVARIFYKK
jgi:predicted unusual protein kinase regulating ubiquinone biosynthesis (AarF/ABC1/UbiB family)